MASDVQTGVMASLSYGVLLYYRFVEIEDPHLLEDWFTSLCSRLSIVGRIRVAPGGVNVTVGGTITSLHQHMEAVESHPLLQGCDFKLAAADSIPLNTAIAKEVGFDCLSVRVVKELVTLRLHPSKCPSISNAGEHLSAVNFHKKIERAAYKYSDGSSSSEGIYSTNEDKELVILDVRNIYETRIGKFVPPEGVKFLDPKLRQYSDLPNWIDNNVEMLQDKCVLMYCTGGVRCEMASAYLKTKGKGFDAIFQLSGGIQRYLEAFPSGGYFKGKNFVFDHRLAVASSSNEVIGSCMNCGIAFDDYSPRCRCSYCRMLLLICMICQVNSVDGQQPAYRCELCRVSDKRPNLQKEPQWDAGAKNKSRLRILCLHGFRQSASSLKGRLASFAKKLKDVAELVFVDAPHEIPLVYSTHSFSHFSCLETKATVNSGKGLHQVHSKKYAWLVTPDMQETNSSEVSTPHSNADVSCHSVMDFDRYQYRKQTAGWMQSSEKLKSVFSELGPFDGLLGFSQGAAIAASLCFLQDASLQMTFRFVILCSGFLSPAPEHQKLMSSSASLPLDIPSLHLFGDGGGDRQISTQDSVEVASLFKREKCQILRHKSGHIIPCQKDYIEKIKTFLYQFL